MKSSKNISSPYLSFQVYCRHPSQKLEKELNIMAAKTYNKKWSHSLKYYLEVRRYY